MPDLRCETMSLNQVAGACYERIGTRRAIKGRNPPAQFLIGSPYGWSVCEDCRADVHEAMICCAVTRCLDCDEKHGLAIDIHFLNRRDV